jgi:hypothetical protein
MAQINKSSEYFNTKLYTGNGSTQSITGVNFQPDMVWTKIRNGVYDHNIFDVIRGVTKDIRPNTTNAEGTQSGGLTSFDSDGYSLGSWVPVNESSSSYVSWNWLGGGTGVSNTDGDITSTVSASTTSGFSIVSYTGNATDGATVGHGLGASPACIIFKNRIDSSSARWAVYHKGAFVSQADPNILYLESSAATADDVNVLGNTTVTLNSTIFSLGDYNGTNGNTDGIIAYCFAEKKGYSKFGSYTGNGNADGTFIYTGFKPAFILVKSSSASGTGWNILDNKRDTENVMDTILQPSNSDAEVNDANKYCDFLSNGFKWRASGGETNGSGTTYIYMAFAENPLVGTNNIPTTAR